MLADDAEKARSVDRLQRFFGLHIFTPPRKGSRAVRQLRRYTEVGTYLPAVRWQAGCWAYGVISAGGR